MGNDCPPVHLVIGDKVEMLQNAQNTKILNDSMFLLQIAKQLFAKDGC